MLDLFHGERDERGLILWRCLALKVVATRGGLAHMQVLGIYWMEACVEQDHFCRKSVRLDAGLGGTVAGWAARE